MIPGIMIGVMKRAAKLAAKKSGIPNIPNFTDADVLLLNRLKKVANKKIYLYLEKELNIPQKDLKKIVKNYNQTKKMVSYATGSGFRDAIRSKIRGKLKLSLNATIGDLDKAIDQTLGIGEGSTINTNVESLVRQVENELKLKVNGVTNKRKTASFNTNLLYMFNPKKYYTRINVIALEDIIDRLLVDIELYETGTGGEVIIVDNGDGSYNVHSKNVIIRYIRDIKSSVKAALMTEEDVERKRNDLERR